MITIEGSVLAAAMKRAAAVVESRNTIPILANVRLQADGAALQIAATDLDVQFTQTLPLAGGGQLATTVDARRLAALAGAVERGAQIRLELKDGRLQVASGRSRWLLPALPVDDFPILPAAADTTEITITGKALAGAADQIMWSASNEVTRYYLCGALLERDETGQLVLVTTNGNTLAFARPGWTADAAAESAIVPTKFMRLAAALGGENDGDLTLAWSKLRIALRADDWALTGKSIDGSFPDWRRVVPPIETAPVRFVPESLAAAVKRTQLIASEKTRSIKLEPMAGLVRLSMASESGGEASEEVPGECEALPARGFNSQYLLQAVDAVGGDSIELHHAAPAAPALLRRVTGGTCEVVVMPMRV